MQTAVKLPKLAETTDMIVVEEWLVAEGDTVAEGQALASVETDKALVECPAPWPAPSRSCSFRLARRRRLATRSASSSSEPATMRSGRRQGRVRRSAAATTESVGVSL